MTTTASAASVSMVERVARALCRAFVESRPNDLGPAGLWVERYWPDFKSQARAAIEAIREPTHGMNAAGGLRLEMEMFEEPEGTVFDAAGRIYACMIDAALAGRGDRE